MYIVFSIQFRNTEVVEPKMTISGKTTSMIWARLETIKFDQFLPLKMHFTAFSWIVHNHYPSLWSNMLNVNMLNWFSAINHHIRKEYPVRFEPDQKLWNLTNIHLSKKTHFTDFRWVFHNKYVGLWSYILDLNVVKWF